LARSFAKKEILPVAELYDRNDEYPWPIIKKALKLGLISSNVPEEYGGPGYGVLEECIINEELAWACSGIQTVLMLNNLAAWPIILAGNEDQKERYLPRLTQGGELGAYGLTEPAAGSDVAGILTTASRRATNTCSPTKPGSRTRRCYSLSFLLRPTSKASRYDCFVVTATCQVLV
jgi:acyl-CoA dehydrogenase